MSVTGERPIEHKALLCFVNRAAGWEGGAGGRRRGPVAGGPAQRVPAMGRHEDITALVFNRAEQGQVPRRAGTSIVALGRSFMPSRRTERSRLAGRGPVWLPQHDTRSVRVGERHCPPACLRRLQAAERNGAKAVSARASVFVFFEVGRGCEAECSGLKRRSQASLRRQSANQSAEAQTCRCDSHFPSEHRNRSDWVRSLPTPLQRARGPRCAACALEARAGWNVCERSEFGAVLAERCLACLRNGTCRNEMKRPRRCEPHWPQRSGSRSGVEPYSREGVRRRRASQVARWCAKRMLASLGWPSNTLCRLRRLAGLTALRKTGRPWAQLRKQAADTMP